MIQPKIQTVYTEIDIFSKTQMEDCVDLELSGYFKEESLVTFTPQEFETFKIGVLIQEARKKQHLTQQQLAEKVGTTKNYISRIENNASDIRLSTLMRIIREGLGGNLKLSMDI